MPSTSNFDLTYNQQNVVAGGALSNPAATTGAAGSGVDQIVAGSNITVSPTSGLGTVTISASGGGTGTVTNVGSGTGLTGGPITTTGTLSIANTGVSASTYGDSTHVPQIAVNAQGQITSASSTAISFPTAPVTSVSGSGSGISVSPTTGSVVVSNTGVTSIIAGSNITISPSGGTGAVTINSTAGGTGTVTSVATGTGLSGGPITTSGTISLASAYAGNGIGTVNGIAKGNGSGTITAATAGTDYVIPSGSITGTSGNVTGTVAIGNGGTGATTASGARTNLGLGTVATQTAPSGTSSQLLANNGTGGFNNVTVGSGLSYSGGTLTATTGGGGTVTSVGTAGSVNGITLSGGPITTSGTITLGGTLGSIANSQLSNSSITVTAGTGLSGGGSVSLGGSTTLTNAGVTSLTAGTGISLSGSTGGVTITNTASFPSGSQGQALLEGPSSTPTFYTQSYNVNAFSSLSAAITAAGSNGVLYFPTAYTIPSGTTISIPIVVEGLLTCSGTATFNGTIKAPLKKIFSGGTVSIGPATPEIFPEWFGTYKDNTNDDATAITAALNAATTSGGSYNQWVVLTGSYYIGSSISMVYGKMFKVVAGASFYPYSTYTGDAVIFTYNTGGSQGASVISDVPSLYNFTTGSGISLLGNQAIEVRCHTIKNCNIAVKTKGFGSYPCNTNIVKVNFMAECYTGFFFTDDGTAATIQGNEYYCNFFTNDFSSRTGLAAVKIDNLNCSNWDGNLVSIKSIDLGNSGSSYGFYNSSSTLLPCWVLECALWMGGIGSANWSTSAFVKGPYSSCTFRMRMSGALGSFPWTTIAMTGFQNRVEFINGGGNYNYTADPAYGGQPISAYKVIPTANSRNTFNTAGTSVTNSASFNNRYTCKYEIGAYSSIPANGLLTLYVYTPITDAYVQGYSNGYPIVAASNNFNAIPFTNEGLVFESAYDNSTVNANEVVLNFRNVSGSTISGGFFNFIFTCGL